MLLTLRIKTKSYFDFKQNIPDLPYNKVEFFSVKNLADAKESLGPDEVKKSAFNLIMVRIFIQYMYSCTTVSKKQKEKI